MMKNWRVILGFLISAGFLFYAFRGQDYGRIRDALRNANYAFLIPALAAYFSGVVVRAFRWRILLRPLVDVPTREVVPINAVGFMANNILPLRTGELVRSYVVSKRFGVRKTAVLATIAVERLFDGLTMLGFIVAAATVVSLTSDLRHVAIAAFALFSIGLIGLFVLTLGGDFRDRLLQIVLGPLPTPVADKVEHMAESFLSGLGVLKRRTDLALVFSASVVAWLFEASTYFLVARAFGGELSDALKVPETLLTTGIANMATLIPSGPSYVGTFERGITLVVHDALGVSTPLALSYAILLHATLSFPVTIWGAIEWWRQHLSLRSVRELEPEPNGTSESPEPVMLEAAPARMPRRAARR